MRPDPLQLGFIGCSGYAYQLFKRVATLPRFAKVVAAISREPGSEGSRAYRERKIPTFFTVEEMLEYGQGKLDAIFNPTPIHLHETITLQCLAAGIPVFVEKPPVASLEEHRNLIRASEKSGIPVAVCFNGLYSFLTQQLKGELVRGRYGAIRRIRSLGGWIRTRTYYQRNDWAGRVRLGNRWVLDGTINNPFAHQVANALYFASPEHHAMASPSTVEAELYHGNPIESEDTSSMRIITTDGIEIVTNFTLCAEEPVSPVLTIECEEAVINCFNSDKMEITFPDGRREERESYREDRLDMIEELYLALRTGERFLCDIRMCLPFTSTINAAFLSAWPICPVPEQALRRSSYDGSERREIMGISQDLLRAHRNGNLLSEIGVTWARPGRIVPVEQSTSIRQLDEAAAPETNGHLAPLAK